MIDVSNLKINERSNVKRPKCGISNAQTIPKFANLWFSKFKNSGNLLIF